jgi:DNA-binding CsgD family transcriptional regulator
VIWQRPAEPLDGGTPMYRNHWSTCPEGTVVGNELSDLTHGESAVLRLVVAGLSIPEIAAALGISPALVRWRLDRVRDRYGCRNRVELIIRALREGWLTSQQTAPTGVSQDE